MKRLQTISPLVIIAILFAGCGGPPFKKQFQEWVGFEIAKHAPVRLKSISISNDISSGNEAMFDFEGTIEITEDLYSRVSVIDEALLNQSNARAIAAKVDAAKFNEIKVATGIEQIASVTIVERTSKRGEKLEVSGKAVAQKTGDETWGFAIREIRGGDVRGSKPPSGTWYEKSSSEAKQYEQDAEQKIVAFAQAVEELALATEKQREEEAAKIAEAKRKEEERLAAEQHAKVSAMLEAVSSAANWQGSWTSKNARGSIGLKFTAQEQYGERVILEGYVFDPANPSNQKPFLGNVLKSTDEQFPYKLVLTATAGRGGVALSFPDTQPGKSPHARILKQMGIYDTTAGLLYAQRGWEMTLKLSNNNQVLAGEIRGLGNDAYNSFSGIPSISLMRDGVTQVEGTTIDSPTKTPQTVVTLEVIQQMINTGQDLSAIIQQLSTQAEPLSQAVIAASNSGDKSTAGKLLNRLGAEFPAAPQSLFWALSMSIQQQNKKGAQAVYSILKHYPLDTADREQLEQMMQQNKH